MNIFLVPASSSSHTIISAHCIAHTIFHFHSASCFFLTQGFQLLYDTQRVKYDIPADVNTYFPGSF